MALVWLGFAAYRWWFRTPVSPLLAAWRSGGAPHELSILNPADAAVVPRDMAAPTFRWDDRSAGAKQWCLAIEFRDWRKPLWTTVDRPEWKPDAELWDQIKDRSLDRPATVTVLGVDPLRPTAIVSGGSSTLQTSSDEVAAPIFFRDVPLPFIYAVKNPETIRWRLGDVSSGDPPPVVLQNLPVCGNCHSFSRDGQTLGMDVDYANDKGSYAVTQVAAKTVLDRGSIFTWNDYRREDGVRTYGLLSQVSPDGRYVISTVKDRSVFSPKDDLTYSQLFFPIRGVLGVYDRQTKQFRALPGADDSRYVQSNPNWSPDGKYIVFARAEAVHIEGEEKVQDALMPPYLVQDFLQGKRGIQFDLYRIPFNEGRGGNAEPIRGASQNGMSHYFPRISPDGRWLVFCTAKNFMLLQPDSNLYILPAEGGVPRRMTCNLSNMNSWHSWSPNGRWLVFSSKVAGPYTRLYLTHVAEDGSDSPAILLESFTLENRAANIPEFVNISRGGLTSITERFLNDYNFHRRADEMASVYGDFAHAVEYYKKALAADPNNVDVRAKLGYAYSMLGDMAAAERECSLAVKQGPSHLPARLRLAYVYLQTGRVAEVTAEYEAILKNWPSSAEAHQNLAAALYQTGNLSAAVQHGREAVQIEPDRATAHLNLGVMLEELGKREESQAHYRAALRCDPLRAADCLQIAQRLATVPALTDDVIGLLKKVVHVKPKLAPAYALLGDVYFSQGNLTESLRNFRIAQESEPRADWLKAKIDEVTNLLKAGKP